MSASEIVALVVLLLVLVALVVTTIDLGAVLTLPTDHQGTHEGDAGSGGPSAGWLSDGA